MPSEHETECSTCHLEHLGREAAITRVGDGRCLPCHELGSFNREHPQFAPHRQDSATENIPGDETLKFPHIARITWDAEGGCYVLEDLDSLNGTDLDGQRVAGPEPLGHLHVITFAGEHD